METKKRNVKWKAMVTSFLLTWIFTITHQVSARNIERYDTAYECEGKLLKIECRDGEVIHLIRANYGRFSITICNEHGNTDWSVNCMSQKSFRVLYNMCNQQQNCSIAASTSQFGDPCPNTLKYLEAHYQCVTAVTPSTTATRLSPPWVLTSQPSAWSTGLPTARPPSWLVTPSYHSSTTTTTTTSTTTTTTASSSSVKPAKAPSEIDFAEEADGDNEEDDDEDDDLPPQNANQNSKHWVTKQTPLEPSRKSDLPEENEEELDNRPYSPIPSTPSCPATDARNINWKRSEPGDVVIQNCPGGAMGTARWKCGVNGWTRPSPDLSECKSRWLTSLDKRVKEGEVIPKISSELAQVTNNSKELYGGDMFMATSLLRKMADRMAKDSSSFQDPAQRESSVSDMLQGAVTTCSNLLDAAQAPSWEDLDYKYQVNVATNMLIGLEENAFLLADILAKETRVIHKQRNILMEVRILEARKLSTELQVFPDELSDERWSTLKDRVELTKGALLGNDNRDGFVRLVFMAFDRIEDILQPENDFSKTSTSSSYNNNEEVQSKPSNVTRILNTKVISASLGKGKHVQLAEPVRLYFRHLTLENVTNPKCVFWDYTTSIWSEDGCITRESNKTHTTCECNHLTNFAVLMDVRAVPLNPSHQVALEIITYVGCIISVICLVLAIFTFQLFRGLKSDRTTIHKNLCICLLIAEVLFMFGIGQTDQRLICGIVAGLLHFFFLSAFAWMFLEGFQLYVMLIEVFEAEKSRLRWYYLVAYGTPLLVVIGSCLIDHLSYGTDRYCWLRADNYFIYTFVGPVIFVILANLVFLSMAIYMMCRHANATASMKSKEHSRLASIRTWIRGAIVLVFLLGLTWAFGLLYINEESLVMAYIFTVLNSLQGMFIFAFHCVQNDKVRKEYRKFIQRHSWLPKCLRCSKSTSSTSGTSVGVANGGKDYVSHNTSSNPSAPTTDSSGLSPHAVANYLASGRGWSTTERQVSETVSTAHEPSASEAHVVSTLPYARHNYFTPASNNPKSNTATWGPLNKNLMWKNISCKSHFRDSHHDRDMDSPRAHGSMTLQGYHHQRGNMSRRTNSPYNHTYTEIREGCALAVHQRHHDRYDYQQRQDDPVYEEIERSIGPSEVLVSDVSDEDGRRQSDMSRQSSRSYGDHRPLIPYSPGILERPMRRSQQPDHTRTVAVLDGHTVVCHLQPQTDLYSGRGPPPPSYTEC